MKLKIIKIISLKFYNLLSRLYNNYHSQNDKSFFRRIFVNDKNYKSIDFESGLTVGDFDGNKYLIKCTPSNVIETHIYKNSNWELFLLNIISSTLGAEKEVVLDIGANIGATSIPLAKKHKNIHFHCFEPNPSVYRDLEFNVSINSLKNLYMNNKAVSNLKKPHIKFYAQTASPNMGLSSIKLNPDIDEYDKILVDNISIDEYTFNLQDRVAVIKIDTQGSELSVLKSAEKTIIANKPIIFFEFEDEYFKTSNDKIMNKRELLKFFSNLNYKIYYLSDHQFFPKITFDDYFNGDIIAVPFVVA